MIVSCILFCFIFTRLQHSRIVLMFPLQKSCVLYTFSWECATCAQVCENGHSMPPSRLLPIVVLVLVLPVWVIIMHTSCVVWHADCHQEKTRMPFELGHDFRQEGLRKMLQLRSESPTRILPVSSGSSSIQLMNITVDGPDTASGAHLQPCECAACQAFSRFQQLAMP